MFKTGIKAIKNLTDYWYHLSNEPNNQVVNKSMKSLEFITASYHRGISYDSSYKVGDFVWIEFGHNPKPELSFEHIGIIFMKQNHTYYVLPITTPKSHNRQHLNAYHEVENPNGTKKFVLIKRVDFPFLKHDSLVKTSELRVVSEARLGNVLGHKELEDPKIIDIWRIAHSFYFPSYDYKMNNLIKENSFLKMMIVASKINKTYTINEFTDLNDLIDIDTTKYTLEIGIPKLMSSTQYMVEIKMSDTFNQKITKSVECRLKTD